MPLADLEDRLLRGDDVAPVAVEQDEAAEAVHEEALEQVAEQVEIEPRRRRERAGQVEVMVRVAQPLQRRREDPSPAIGASLRAQDLAQQEAVGEDRQVPAVLLQRRDRQHHRDVASKGGHRRPAHVGQFHLGPLPGAGGRVRGV